MINDHASHGFVDKGKDDQGPRKIDKSQKHDRKAWAKQDKAGQWIKAS